MAILEYELRHRRRIAEIVGGKPLVEQLRTRIFEPLQMTGVRDQDASHLPPSDPTGYYQHALGPLRPAPLEGSGWMFAQASWPWRRTIWLCGTSA